MDDSIDRGASWLDAKAESLLEEMSAKADAVSGIATVTDEGRPRAQAAVLIDIGKTHKLFHDSSDPYAKVGGGAYSVTGVEYKEILGQEYYRLTGKGANRNALSDAATTLAAMAKFDGQQAPVHLRVGEHDGGIVIDGGDPRWCGYHVTSDAWLSVADLPIYFRRSGKPLPLPKPTAPDFSRLWRHVNVAKEHRVLVAAWLLAALRPCGPYPLLALIAEQGSGKSHTSRTLKALTDPSASPLRSPPRDERDLLVAAVSSRVLALDNLSGLDHRLSDALCRLATGGALSGRKLYTDSDETLIEVQRPVILNGIDDLANRPDLSERCLHITLPPIVNRMTEKEMHRTFRDDSGAIFAALLDGVALALRDMDIVKLGRLPRMADFAKWAAAGIPALGFSSEEFITAYRRNQAEAIEIGLDSSPVGHAIRAFMADRDKWTGTSDDLLRRLASLSDDSTDSKAWPRSPKGMVNALRRLAPALRHVGIVWTHERTEAARLHTLCKVRLQASEASEASGTQSHQWVKQNAKRQPSVSKRHAQASASVSQSAQASEASAKRHVQATDSDKEMTDMTLMTLKNRPCTIDGRERGSV